MWSGTVEYKDVKDEGEDRRTVFFLKPLSIGDMMDIEGTLNPVPNGPGTKMKRALELGLTGWVNFWILSDEDTLQELAYSKEAISYIPPDVRQRLVNEIFRISVLTEDIVEEIRNAVRSAFLRYEAKDSKTWDCSDCKLKKLQAQRNCPELDKKDRDPLAGINKSDLKPWDIKNLKQGKLSRWMNQGHGYKQCPILLSSPRAEALLSLVIDCINQNVLPVNPPTLLNQPYIYMQAKNIYESEKAAIEKKKKDREKEDVPEDSQIVKDLIGERDSDTVESLDDKKEAAKKKKHDNDLMAMIRNRVRNKRKK